jgi:signal transduction histidine kinase
VINAIEALSFMDTPRTLQIRSMAVSTHALVSDQDSGPGLCPADWHRVFQAFYTTKSNGMGVGLSICRTIIESHHGRIWAGQSNGRGATFNFALPFCA